MKSAISLVLIYSLMITSVFGQSVNPNDTLKIGKPSSSSDKGITFDTNDGVSNKKLLIEKISKKLKFDGNTFQIGDGSGSSDKELIIAGALKSLKYNGTSGEFEFNDDVKLSGILKADFLQAVNAEVAINSLLRASQGIKVGSGANEIRVASGNLEFSNDGVLYKKFGTGSGGGSTGVNLLANDSFEDGISTGWTSSGGTFSQQSYTNAVEGDAKYARYIASGAGQYFETTAVVVSDSMTGGCQADFKKYNTVTASAFKVQAISGASTVLAEQTLSAGSWIKAPTISFVCPSAGTSVKLRLISSLAGTIEVDKAYLGSNQNLVSVAQARLMGTVTITGCSGNWTTSSTIYASFGTQTGCSYAVTGQALAPSTNIPAIKFSSLPAGDYRLEYEGALYNSVAVKNSYYQFSDGTNTARENAITYSGTAGLTIPGLSQTISYGTTQSNVTLEIKAKVDSGGGANLIGTTTIPSVIKVWYFPSSTETAVSPEQASWFIDANIGGANMTTSSTSSYTEITNASLDMVINSTKGSANAEIPCSGTNSSTGLTCSSGSESLGISFVPLLTGRHRICFSINPVFNGAGGIAVNTVYQVIKTPNNAQTILEEGSERTQSFVSINNSGTGAGQKICGNFNISDLSKQTFRLMSEQSTVNGFQIQADRSSIDGQRDIHVSVENLTFGQNRPILLDTPIVKASYWASSTNTVSINTQINYDSKEFDSHNAVTVGVGSWKFTTPANGAGTYLISGKLNFSTGSELTLFKNNVAYKQIGWDNNVIDSSFSNSIILNVGDFIDVRPNSASPSVSGGTLATSPNNLSITRVGL